MVLVLLMSIFVLDISNLLIIQYGKRTGAKITLPLAYTTYYSICKSICNGGVSVIWGEIYFNNQTLTSFDNGSADFHWITIGY